MFFYTALQYQECSSSMWETWIQLPCLPAAAQTLFSLQIEKPAIRWDVEDAGACIPPSWGVQRCTSSFFLIKYFLFFFKQQGLPWQRQSTWKTGQRISPISRAWDTHGAGSTQKHITPPSCSHKRAAAGLVSSLGFFRCNMARRNASYKGPSRPSAQERCQHAQASQRPPSLWSGSRATPVQGLGIENLRASRVSSPAAPGCEGVEDFRLLALEYLLKFLLISVGSAWIPHEPELQWFTAAYLSTQKDQRFVQLRLAPASPLKCKDFPIITHKFIFQNQGKEMHYNSKYERCIWLLSVDELSGEKE